MTEWMSGIMQAIFGSALYELLFAGLVATLLAFLEKRFPSKIRPTLTAVYGFALIVILAYVLTGHALLSNEQPPTTVSNVESNIQAWAKGFQFNLSKEPEDPSKYFNYYVPLTNGNGCNVMRVKTKDHYVFFDCNVNIASSLYDKMEKLTPSQMRDLYQSVDIELARFKLPYDLLAAPGLSLDNSPLKTINVTRVIPISTAFTELVFVDALQEMDSAMTVARDSFDFKFKTLLPPSP